MYLVMTDEQLRAGVHAASMRARRTGPTPSAAGRQPAG
jgi:hypothetical protein